MIEDIHTQLSRRDFLGYSAATLGLSFATASTTTTSAPADASCRELIQDRHFQQGFQLLEPKLGQKKVYGQLPGIRRNTKPVWDLAQWSSRFPLKPDRPEQLPSGGLRFANQAKAVTIGPRDSKDADLSLSVLASIEYGQRARKIKEPWVHLLVSQQIPNPPSISQISSARFQVAARLKHSQLIRTDDYSPRIHAAHIQVFLSLQNLNKHSPGYGQYLWFGLPLYDDRHRMPPAYKAQDRGGTKMFIYTCAAEDLTLESTHDRKWVTIDRNLLPLMHSGLKTAWSRGFLKDSHNLEDYHIAGMNLGWEVPGIFDVDMQIKDLSLSVCSEEKGLL